MRRLERERDKTESEGREGEKGTIGRKEVQAMMGHPFLVVSYIGHS